MTAHIVAQFRLHLRAPDKFAPQVAPAMVRLDVEALQRFVYPLAQPLGDLVPLRVRSLSAPGARWLIEKRLADAPALLNVFQKFLLDEMLVHGDASHPLALRDLGPQ